MLNIFASRNNADTHPWFSIDLIVPLEITGIEIVERKDKWAHLTNNIEVRVGDTKPFDAMTNGNTLYSSNTVCGVFIGPGQVGDISVVTCSQPLTGRYVTLQRISMDDMFINWSEVLIKSKSMESKITEILKMDADKNPVAKCPPTTGLSECPSTHPYSYKQGNSCCKENIEHDKRTT